MQPTRNTEAGREGADSEDAAVYRGDGGRGWVKAKGSLAPTFCRKVYPVVDIGGTLTRLPALSMLTVASVWP